MPNLHKFKSHIRRWIINKYRYVSIKCTLSSTTVKMKSLFGKILNVFFSPPRFTSSTGKISVKQLNFPTHKRFSPRICYKFISEYCKAQCLFSVKNLFEFKLFRGKVFFSRLLDWILFIGVFLLLMLWETKRIFMKTTSCFSFYKVM